MSIALLFKELYKPIIHTIKQIGFIFVNSENWWISKSSYTKLNLRWIFFTMMLFSVAVIREIKVKEDELANYNRNLVDIVFLQKKSDLLEQRYLSKLEEDIKELKEIRKMAEKSDEQLKRINK